MIKIYTLPTCPKCKILKEKMKQKNIDYVECQDTQEMMDLHIEGVPQLLVEEKLLDYATAIKWINEYK